MDKRTCIFASILLNEITTIADQLNVLKYLVHNMKTAILLGLKESLNLPY